MSKDDDDPNDENNRGPDDESDDGLTDLRIVKLVLEIAVLIARLLRQL